MAKAKSAVPAGHHTVTPQLTLDNAAQAIDWYKKALGAEEVARGIGPKRKTTHAEIRTGDSLTTARPLNMGGDRRSNPPPRHSSSPPAASTESMATTIRGLGYSLDDPDEPGRGE